MRIAAQRGTPGLRFDAHDRDTAGGERKRDPAGADPELERPTLFGEVRQQLDDRFDRRRIEHLGGALVVDRRGALVEEALAMARVCWHDRSLPGGAR